MQRCAMGADWCTQLFGLTQYSAYLLDKQNKISGIYINVNTTYTF